MFVVWWCVNAPPNKSKSPNPNCTDRATTERISHAQYIPRIVSAPAEYIPVLSARFARRLAVCVPFSPTLYQESIGHPFWLSGLTMLFATMFFTLVHAWIQTLRGRFR